MLAMAGRSRQVIWVAAAALVIVLVLSCLASLMQWEGSGLHFWQRSHLLVSVGSDLSARQSIAAFWGASPAMRFVSGAYLVIDAVLFIPAYAVLLTGLRGRWHAALPMWVKAMLRWRRWRWPLALAAASDVLENALTWVLVRGHDVSHRCASRR